MLLLELLLSDSIAASRVTKQAVLQLEDLQRQRSALLTVPSTQPATWKETNSKGLK